MMTKSTPKRSLSLGSRYRCLLAFAVLLVPTLLSGVGGGTGTERSPDLHNWKGTVERGKDVTGSSSEAVTVEGI